MSARSPESLWINLWGDKWIWNEYSYQNSDKQTPRGGTTIDKQINVQRKDTFPSEWHVHELHEVPMRPSLGEAGVYWSSLDRIQSICLLEWSVLRSILPVHSWLKVLFSLSAFVFSDDTMRNTTFHCYSLLSLAVVFWVANAHLIAPTRSASCEMIGLTPEYHQIWVRCISDPSQQV